MNKNIYKFPREFLEEGNIHVRKKMGDTSFAAHRHEYYEMILYQKCNGKCIINGSVYPISDNCLFLLTPKDYHKIEAQNPDDAGSFIVSFSLSVVNRSRQKTQNRTKTFGRCFHCFSLPAMI